VFLLTDLSLAMKSFTLMTKTLNFLLFHFSPCIWLTVVQNKTISVHLKTVYQFVFDLHILR